MSRASYFDPNAKVWGYKEEGEQRTEEDIKCFDFLNEEIFDVPTSKMHGTVFFKSDGVVYDVKGMFTFNQDTPAENKTWTFIKDKILVIPVNALTFLLKLVTRMINFVWNR